MGRHSSWYALRKSEFIYVYWQLYGINSHLMKFKCAPTNPGENCLAFYRSNCGKRVRIVSQNERFRYKLKLDRRCTYVVLYYLRSF